MERATDYYADPAEYQLGHGLYRSRTRAHWQRHSRSNLAKLDRDDALAALKKSNIPVTQVNHTRELFDDPQVADDLIDELSYSQWGRVNQTGMLTKFSATPGTIDRAAPMLGEHTDENLRGYLGDRQTELPRCEPLVSSSDRWILRRPPSSLRIYWRARNCSGADVRMISTGLLVWAGGLDLNRRNCGSPDTLVTCQ